jgi:hypothetical protein
VSIVRDSLTRGGLADFSASSPEEDSMGHPEHKIPFTKTKLFLCIGLILLLSFILPTLEGYAAPAPTRSGLPPGDWDHVIITDQSLIRSFTPLADHRTAQGLPSRVISIQELQRYSLLAKFAGF